MINIGWYIGYNTRSEFKYAIEIEDSIQCLYGRDLKNGLKQGELYIRWPKYRLHLLIRGFLNMDKGKIVFVPSCLLCPLMMAREDNADASWSQEIISYLIEKGYFMIQMPCPEASFPDHSTGIARKPHGLKYYQELAGFREHCSNIGKQILEQIDAFYDNGYKISAVLGVENSPTCAVNYTYARTSRYITDKNNYCFYQ